MSGSAFTAATIARALGKTKRGVQQALARTPADKVIATIQSQGQLADAWHVTSLPHRFVQELDGIASRLGRRNAEHLLVDLPRRFSPRDVHGIEVPIGQIAQHHIDRANRFRSALAITLDLRDQLDNDDSRQRAFGSFRRVVNASAKTWERWMKRVLQRDAGEERFDDLALYLDDVVTRKPENRQRIAVAATAADRTVFDALASVADPKKPTLDELALVWVVTCEFIDQEVQSGQKQKRAQRRLLEILSASAVTLARNEEALRKTVKRKFARWIEGGQTLVALEDQRPLNSGGRRAPELAEADREELLRTIGTEFDGRVSEGYRASCNRGSLSHELTSRYIGNPANKSYVPRSIRTDITPDANLVAKEHRGRKSQDDNGPHNTRDWSAVAAGDWMQADDVTAPVYFYKESAIPGHGELTRGQFLPMIDERTTMILGFVLIQQRNYNSISIRSLITEVCAEHGLPRFGFSFERGIWQRSKIITGGGDAEAGLRRLGMKFRHAKKARAKVIERTNGLLQNRMEALPGYCGRNEIIDRYERFNRAKRDVEAARVPASKHFLSATELYSRFAQIVDDYNDERQQGIKLNGLSPREGWHQLQGTLPRARFHAATHYFLASEIRKLKIGRNGITFVIGKQRFNYKGAETGKRIGQTILAWLNTKRPEFLACSEDLAGNGVFVVERSYELPAVGASREQLAAENDKIAAHRQYAIDLYHTVSNSLPSSCFRGQLLQRTEKFGQAIEAQKKEITERKRASDSLESAIARKARLAGVDPRLVRRSPDALQTLDEIIAVNREAGINLQEQNQ